MKHNFQSIHQPPGGWLSLWGLEIFGFESLTSKVMVTLRWGEDASSSQPEPQQQDQGDWWDENSWDGYAGDDGNESESMNLQELQSSLMEAGYAAAAGNRSHHHHHHRNQRNQGDDGGSDSGEATTSNRTISESTLPCMGHQLSFCFP